MHPANALHHQKTVVHCMAPRWQKKRGCLEYSTNRQHWHSVASCRARAGAYGSPRQPLAKQFNEACTQPAGTRVCDNYLSATTSSRRSLLLGTAFIADSVLLTRRPSDASASIVDEDVATRIFDSARTSVVSVATSRNGENLGTGSGLVWTQDGFIVTNFHVVSKVDKSSDVLTVVIQNQDGSTRSLPARVVGTDTMNDLAVSGACLQDGRIEGLQDGSEWIVGTGTMNDLA
ncbi:hypothetical protein DUNSADRAFT_14935, partial [Dunaliella salina]